MSWQDVIKAPRGFEIPEYDINFEYDPDKLKQMIQDWDKQNPATVLHIEISKPDPAERMFDATNPELSPIRFSRAGSQKYVSERVRFITDRAIDKQGGLYQKLRSEGYKVWDKDAKWIKANYQDKLGNLTIPDTAKYYAIGVSKEVAERQRKKNPAKSSKFPDRSRKVEDIEAWNKTKKEYGLDKVEGFAKYIIGVLEKDSMFKQFNKQHLSELESAKSFWPSSDSVRRRIDTNGVINLAKKELQEAFGKNKHDLYLRQQLPINRRWVNENVFIPVLRMKIKEVEDYLESDEYKKERIQEKNARIAEEDRRKKELDNRKRELDKRKEERIKQLRRKQKQPLNQLRWQEQEELDAQDKKDKKQRKRNKKSGKIKPSRGGRGKFKKSWQTILKIDMREARRLGEKYAPRHMRASNPKYVELKEKLDSLLPTRYKKIEYLLEKYLKTGDGDGLHFLMRSVNRLIREAGKK